MLTGTFQIRQGEPAERTQSIQDIPAAFPQPAVPVMSFPCTSRMHRLVMPPGELPGITVVARHVDSSQEWDCYPASRRNNQRTVRGTRGTGHRTGKPCYVQGSSGSRIPSKSSPQASIETSPRPVSLTSPLDTPGGGSNTPSCSLRWAETNCIAGSWGYADSEQTLLSGQRRCYSATAAQHPLCRTLSINSAGCCVVPRRRTIEPRRSNTSVLGGNGKP